MDPEVVGSSPIVRPIVNVRASLGHLLWARTWRLERVCRWQTPAPLLVSCQAASYELERSDKASPILTHARNIILLADVLGFVVYSRELLE